MLGDARQGVIYCTAEVVEERVFNIIESLRTNIVTFYDSVETMVYIDRKLALVTLSMALYFPYTSVGPLFEALSDLEKGDGVKFYNLATNFTETLTVTCQDCNPLTVADAGASPDAGIAIQCADSGPISDDLAFLRGTYTTLSAQTKMVETAFALSVRCA